MKMTLQELVINSFKKYPINILLKTSQKEYSYSDIHTEIEKVFQLLHEKNISIDKKRPILIKLDKSILAYTCILACVMAGVPYIPLDSKTPLSVIEKITKEVDSSCILTNEKKELIIIPTGIRTGSSKIVSSESDTAYILFTSGSTGSPKGIRISNFAAMSFINWSNKELKIQEYDVISNHAPLNFDLSILDIFATIKSGATIVPITSLAKDLGISYINQIIKNRITIWYSVPTAIIEIVNALETSGISLNSIRTLIFAGEPYPIIEFKKLVNIFNDRCDLYNFYGPTETNVCLYYKIPNKKKAMELSSVPIGNATPFCKIIEQENKQHELIVSTDTLFNEYIFLTNNPNIKIDPNGNYATGDLVEKHANEYLYLGRLDNQLKIRGYRIEPEHIENIIESLEGITKSIVFINKNSLVANIELSKKNNFIEGDVEPIFTHLKHHLPPYLIPKVINIVENIELSDRGKKNRKNIKI